MVGLEALPLEVAGLEVLGLEALPLEALPLELAVLALLALAQPSPPLAPAVFASREAPPTLYPAPAATTRASAPASSRA